MSKPKLPNKRKMNLRHKARVERYTRLIQQIYDRFAAESARLASLAGAATDRPFRFSDYPLTREAYNRLRNEFVSNLGGTIMAGTSEEWKQSNLVQDLVAEGVLKAYTGTTKAGEEFTRYFQTNPDALKAFIQRKENGMNLSVRVWELSEQYKPELEDAITAAISPGTSAMELAADVKKYLKEPDKRFRRIKEKLEDGTIKWHLSKPAKEYHPGKGIYRSSARNAQRLARTEINMAYRKAEQIRWEQFDFVVGYEVKTTQNGHHKEDICDMLAGKYPKSFVFTGWHPQCMCYCIPILKTEEEFWADDSEDSTESVNEVKYPPEGFNDWVRDNKERIEAAEKRGTLPNFIKDNPKEVERVLEGSAGEEPKVDAERKENGGIHKEKPQGTADLKQELQVSSEEKAKIEANRKEYERLLADPDYHNVSFNPENGGLMATHKDHEDHANDKKMYFGKFTANDLELRAQNILYKGGHSCILESEKVYDKNGKQRTALDTTTDYERVDIKSITKNGKNTLHNAIRDKKIQLKNFNEENGTNYSSLILYYYDANMFDVNRIRSFLGNTFRKFICLIEPDTIFIIE